jgi:hypothetical protein
MSRYACIVHIQWNDLSISTSINIWEPVGLGCLPNNYLRAERDIDEMRKEKEQRKSNI